VTNPGVSFADRFDGYGTPAPPHPPSIPSLSPIVRGVCVPELELGVRPYPCFGIDRFSAIRRGLARRSCLQTTTVLTADVAQLSQTGSSSYLADNSIRTTTVIQGCEQRTKCRVSPGALSTCCVCRSFLSLSRHPRRLLVDGPKGQGPPSQPKAGKDP